MRNTNPQMNASLPFKSTNVSRGKDEKRMILRGVKLPNKTVSREKDRYMSAPLPVKLKTVSRVKDGKLSTAFPVKRTPVSRVKDGNLSSAFPVKRTTVSRVKDGKLSVAFPVKRTTVSRVKGGNLSAGLQVKLTRVSPGKEGKRLILNQTQNVNSSGVKPTPNPVPIDVNIVLYDPTLCESCPGLRWVFYVHSAPKHRLKRDLIRVTWGNPAFHKPGTTRLVFMLGQTSDPKMQVCG